MEVLESVRSVVESLRSEALVLCGDFNAPQFESSEEIVTWGQQLRKSGAFAVRSGRDRWDAAERWFFCGPDLRDAHRTLHGFSAPDCSWYWRGGEPVGRRFDHCLVSAAVQPVRSEYRHNWPVARLSDHSAVLTVISGY